MRLAFLAHIGCLPRIYNFHTLVYRRYYINIDSLKSSAWALTWEMSGPAGACMGYYGIHIIHLHTFTDQINVSAQSLYEIVILHVFLSCACPGYYGIQYNTSAYTFTDQVHACICIVIVWNNNLHLYFCLVGPK